MRTSLLTLSVTATLVLCSAPRAEAFCGFFVSGSDQKLTNTASQVVLMRKGNRTVMSLSNTYQGPPADFAMVVPVPVVLKKDQVKTLSPQIFEHIEQLTAPRLVEYWEQDPCMRVAGNDEDKVMERAAQATATPSAHAKEKDDTYHVTIEAQFTRGEYEIVILSADDSQGLDGWLRHNGYNIPAGASEAMRPYVEAEQKFFVAKVDVKKVKLDAHQKAVLSPLQFSFESSDLRLPVRLGLLNAGAAQDLIVYVLHPNKRFEVANYKNVFIPTNLELRTSVKPVFHAFYAELFDATLRKENDRAVVTEYAWDTSSCDPCAAPPLEASELSTLGASRVGGANGGWVVTRLHTRYSKDSLSEDLIFSAATPVVGGRADAADGGGPQSAKRESINNFQGRYIVRHAWWKPIACENPQRGIWGGPPDGRQEPPVAARKLDEAPRGQVKLAAMLRRRVRALAIAPGN